MVRELPRTAQALTSQDGDSKLSRTEQAKQLLTQYGSAYLLTSISFAIVSFSICYAAVNAGGVLRIHAPRCTRRAAWRSSALRARHPGRDGTSTHTLVCRFWLAACTTHTPMNKIDRMVPEAIAVCKFPRDYGLCAPRAMLRRGASSIHAPLAPAAEPTVPLVQTYSGAFDARSAPHVCTTPM